jgi:hypothetical protein
MTAKLAGALFLRIRDSSSRNAISPPVEAVLYASMAPQCLRHAFGVVFETRHIVARLHARCAVYEAFSSYHDDG